MGLLEAPVPEPVLDPSLAASPTPLSPALAPAPPAKPAGPVPTNLPWWARAALVLASVALLRLSLPLPGWSPLALVALAPFLLALEGLSPRAALRTGFFWGWLTGAANATWLLAVFPGSPRVAVIALWAVLGFWPALYAYGHALAARRGAVALAVLAPALWIAQEWIRSEVIPLRFSWFTLGHALSGDPWFRQSADLAGVYGLSLLAFATSFVLVRAWVYRRDGRGFVLLSLAVIVPLVFWARGSNILGAAPALGTVPEGQKSLRVLVVQDERYDGRLEPKLSLTRAAVAKEPGKIDAIVWPEASFGTEPFEAGPVRHALEGVAKLARGVFIVGCIEPTDAKATTFWNTALLLRPDGSVQGTYHKRVPVQFLEGVVPGTESPTFEVLGTRIGVLTCYDGTYPFVARDLVKNGAEAILTPSEDLKDWGLTQHLDHALHYPLRACELRRPIARACASGVSFVLDAWGRELARKEPFDPGTAVATIVPETVMTPYVLAGWLLPYVALALVVLGGIGGLVRRPKVTS